MAIVIAMVYASLLEDPARGAPAFSTRRELNFGDDEIITVKTVISRLGIPRGQVGIALVAGKPVNDSEPLKDGAEVSLYPLFGGG